MLSSKSSSKPLVNPWGDDHPEKFSDKPMLSGFANQLKGLVSPTSMLDQLFGVQKSPESQYKPKSSEKRIANIYLRPLKTSGSNPTLLIIRDIRTQY